MEGLVYQGDRTGSTEAPSSLGVPAVRVREAGGSLWVYHQSFTNISGHKAREQG